MGNYFVGRMKRVYMIHLQPASPYRLVFLYAPYRTKLSCMALKIYLKTSEHLVKKEEFFISHETALL
jgi:hypothetical protein